MRHEHVHLLTIWLLWTRANDTVITSTSTCYIKRVPNRIRHWREPGSPEHTFIGWPR